METPVPILYMHNVTDVMLGFGLCLCVWVLVDAVIVVVLGCLKALGRR